MFAILFLQENKWEYRMKKKVVKALLATMALFGAVMVGCGTSDTAADCRN